MIVVGTNGEHPIKGVVLGSVPHKLLHLGDIYATQRLLGNADVSTTANIYVQGSAADFEDKLRKVYGD